MTSRKRRPRPNPPMTGTGRLRIGGKLTLCAVELQGSCDAVSYRMAGTKTHYRHVYDSEPGVWLVKVKGLEGRPAQRAVLILSKLDGPELWEEA